MARPSALQPSGKLNYHRRNDLYPNSRSPELFFKEMGVCTRMKAAETARIRAPDGHPGGVIAGGHLMDADGDDGELASFCLVIAVSGLGEDRRRLAARSDGLFCLACQPERDSEIAQRDAFTTPIVNHAAERMLTLEYPASSLLELASASQHATKAGERLGLPGWIRNAGEDLRRDAKGCCGVPG